MFIESIELIGLIELIKPIEFIAAGVLKKGVLYDERKKK